MFGCSEPNRLSRPARFDLGVRVLRAKSSEQGLSCIFRRKASVNGIWHVQTRMHVGRSYKEPDCRMAPLTPVCKCSLYQSAFRGRSCRWPSRTLLSRAPVDPLPYFMSFIVYFLEGCLVHNPLMHTPTIVPMSTTGLPTFRCEYFDYYHL